MIFKNILLNFKKSKTTGDKFVIDFIYTNIGYFILFYFTLFNGCRKAKLCWTYLKKI